MGTLAARLREGGEGAGASSTGGLARRCGPARSVAPITSAACCGPRALRDATRRRPPAAWAQREFDAVLDDRSAPSIRMQEDAGLGVVTDGEFRRRSWFAGFVDAVDGLEHSDTRVPVRGRRRGAALGAGAAYAGADPARARDRHARARVRSRVARRPAKITLPAPSVIHFYRGPEAIDRAADPDEEAWLAGPDRRLPRRDRRARAARLRHLQLDEVPIALLCDRAHPGADRRVGRGLARPARSLPGGHDRGAARPAGRPDGRDAPLPRQLPRPLDRPPAATSRSRRSLRPARRRRLPARVRQRARRHFRPLRFVRGKGVVLGLVSTKTAALEDPDALRRRIDEAAGVRAARAARAQPAVRLRDHRRRRADGRGRRAAQA